MCVYVYMYIVMYKCTLYIYIHVDLSLSLSLDVYIYICIHIYIYIYIIICRASGYWCMHEQLRRTVSPSSRSPTVLVRRRSANRSHLQSRDPGSYLANRAPVSKYDDRITRVYT